MQWYFLCGPGPLTVSYRWFFMWHQTRRLNSNRPRSALNCRCSSQPMWLIGGPRGIRRWRPVFVTVVSTATVSWRHGIPLQPYSACRRRGGGNDERAHRIGGGGRGGGGWKHPLPHSHHQHLLLQPPLLIFSQWKISKLAVSTTGTKGIIASYYGEGEGEEEVQSQEWSCEIMWQQLPFSPCCNAFIFWGYAEMYVTTAAFHPQPATAAVRDPNNQQKGDEAIKCTGEKRRKNTAWLQTVFYLKQRSFQKSPCFSRSK